MKIQHSSDEVVVLDFETTGLSPNVHRIIEVGAVRVKNKCVTDRYVQLMYPGRPISSFISRFTGITNQMLKGQPKPEQVMPKLKSFIGQRPIVAHNASFDKRFLLAEMARAGIQVTNPFLCTLLLARRLVPELPDFKLATLTHHYGIENKSAHRALADAEATAEIWTQLRENVQNCTGLTDLDTEVFEKIHKLPRWKVGQYLSKISIQ